MSRKFPEYKELDLSGINKEVLELWDKNDTFKQSLKEREGCPSFVFYEGPPSANGMPGIHHVMARTVKDVICRYKTQKGFLVHRKAGWDTHGLPVELGVEQRLGIRKDDIGKKISVAEYNKACRSDVMKYTDMWEDLTSRMGYWVDMDDPYITYDNRYIETLWWMLSELHKKGYLYKGYTIQPYSPAAGTGLSTHELNQPGCYRDVKDTTCTAQFKVIRNEKSEFLFAGVDTDLFILAWTTTPWTLPSNTALAVGADISYVKVKTFNPYTGSPIRVILAEDLVGAYFNMKDAELSMEDYKPGDKHIPFRILDGKYTGAQLEGVRYEQLMPWVKPEGDAFRVIVGDFVTTSDGTGIVHIAPTFGADDDRAARQAGVSPLLMIDKDGKRQPMVDRNGRFFRIEDLHPDFVAKSVNVEKYSEFAGRYVKNAYDERLTDEDATLDVDLSVMLKKEDRAFKVGKHIHSYPHCWRTDKPVLYYPLDSWFIRTTALRERMIELNNTINWKPASTGSGRFGKWLENLVDWNLSRSRYWGTPLPIWRTEDGSQELCIGSVEQLFSEIEKSVKAGLMKKNPFEGFVPGDYSKENYEKIDLHRPYVDEIILVSDEGKAMYREPDLIDVWFDSGAMPYAQMHYPFESKDNLPFPADFIAEGVDQTRGWFFTLHALATLLFDSVAFKNIISNGLVLDKNGNKMSKRLGNAVDPFAVIEQYGSDPLRWYMMTNSQPWDNLKFDISGVDEVKRKFFGTLYNTYSFFSLYANVDGFVPGAEEVPVAERPEIDRWIISVLNSLVKEVENAYSSYEPTRAGRALQDFVIENLSNWYVRLNRKRFWAGEYNKDKIAAYQTLYTCLKTVAVLSAPIAPFFMEKLYLDLTGENKSVHLAMMPECNEALIDLGLEERMSYAQQISSMVLALRRKVSIKVRQPLQKIMIPDMGVSFREQIDKIKDLVLSEVNVKELEYLADDSGVLVKKIKPNFKTLGPKHGKLMKGIAAVVNTLTPAEITHFEREGRFEVEVEGSKIELLAEDVEIISEDIPGWLVANEGKLTVALDITITEELRQEGLARELVNRIQNIRKDSGFEITDKIELYIRKHEAINNAVMNFTGYIGTQTLAPKISLVDECNDSAAIVVELDSDIETAILVKKISN
ncbi:isoleucine--tRNA ligase [Xiashengella succiniciproducens]|uniref:Isoleucine--tRNA ligase n=1 Tax=Xiashengella succiniciproducens TaxID=2949635 RepID=A0A9J6ZTD8_9BACT|nr:isoleucine--tRNA ligase [Alkaliflexus sp. Ai-910]URW80835.1 isoleucine--tRNA ligase [Alkaliflexus sp. Ai-910]HHU01279.1 isoleucine--tRNA ligase [Bacteroidales bacterium]